jgi:hypothetical protein
MLLKKTVSREAWWEWFLETGNWKLETGNWKLLLAYSLTA